MPKASSSEGGTGSRDDSIGTEKASALLQAGDPDRPPRGVRTPCCLARSNGSADSSKAPSGESKSDSAGAGIVGASAKAKLGIFGQCKAAIAADQGCVSHCSGSVGVAGRSGVAGTT